MTRPTSNNFNSTTSIRAGGIAEDIIFHTVAETADDMSPAELHLHEININETLRGFIGYNTIQTC